MEAVVSLDQAFWQGKRVFVTGHTGFKGGWLCLWLQRLGADITGYALKPPTNPCLFDVARVGEGMRSVIGDVRDPAHMNKIVQEVQPEIVIHMAAQPLVRYSYRHPVETYETNVMGTVHLLEAVRGCASVKSILVVTSDKCYENRERQRGYKESDPLGGFDPYSSSKACAELVTSAYRRSYFDKDHGIGVATARAGNVIGGGDWSEDRLIPDMVRAWHKGKPVRIRHPKAVRPWQHVLEALHGYLLLIERLAEHPQRFSGAWNFGPEDKEVKPVEWMVSRFADAWGGGRWQKAEIVDGLHEAGLLQLDCSKTRESLGWHPVLRVEDAVDWAASWYRAFEDGSEMHCFTRDQISKYEALQPA
ncbi:CDP-glucose 4,6-dehydratase [Candidatus Parcubacteria bacterium]|nr:MAG: CDP-glucose 4,6-dehydratase [Candidatus Parcubacteria bacterium]